MICSLLPPPEKESIVSYMRKEVFGPGWIEGGIRGAMFSVAPHARMSPLVVTNNSTESVWKSVGAVVFNSILHK